ncbi:dye-decolorizing peroxidase YfeX-like isoform X2 [Babylonia areolata]|uniref:dye-decolorizing peroxidase YfeX-like isoform X2 n=1 Tax=Babylonia areolata TaxID=304850 RepID=UPI003FCF58E7
MASLRSSLTLLRSAVRQGCRPISTRSTAGRKATPLLLGAATAAVGVAGYGVYRVWGSKPSAAVEQAVKTVQDAMPSVSVSAAGPPQSQPSVYSQTKDHALYLWINLKPTANPREVARVMAKLQKYVDEVCDPTMRDEDDEVLAGVGFGPNLYSQVAGKTKESYHYPHRKGALGDMPSTGGDVFVHAKSHQISKLFELGQVVLKNLPKDSVESFEDIYSFVFRNGRDLSGFIDGTENPADEDDRREVAVEKATGGSYVITQKWIHDLNLIGSEKDKTMEGWVGRTRADSVELNRKSISSHVARMTGGNAFGQKKPVQIVRQSMPFGTLSGEAGLFFIGYAASPYNHEFMLDRMVGAGGDGHSDDIMRFSKNVKGTYWYFPGTAELKKLE